MAELLGLSGEGAADTLRKVERGKKPISGPIKRLARYIQQGTEVNAEASLALPTFMLCAPLEIDSDVEWVMHTKYPRFLAPVTEQPVEGLVCATVDGVEWLCVALWIDEPLGDPQKLVDGAAVLFARYTAASN